MPRMSQDRVHFTIPGVYLEKQTYRDCVAETLGVDARTLKRQSKHFQASYEDLHVICRPSQFARFIILRHVKYEEQNNMAPLNMKLVKPEPEEVKPLDVSGNPDKSSGAP